MMLGEAAAPADMRVYAVGDVHGCDRLLAETHRHIFSDLAERPVRDYRVIHLGDYVDRGPDSRAVIERLVALTKADGRVMCLRGNHEDVLLSFLRDPIAAAPGFLTYGGVATLASYGVRDSRSLWGQGLVALRDRFLAVLPPAHLTFLMGLPYSARLGDFLFVHAGIRPGVPLAGQTPEDLTWIREEFLDDPRDHGVVVVHGHTPVDSPELRRNRINLDTGAFASQRLTCLALEGRQYRFV
jgi:serine/threonine protein phosphatase 1